MNENIHENVVSFPGKTNKRKKKNRINRGKKGSVRRINGKAYVDFLYLGERVRESSGLAWNEKNVEEVRGQLNRIMDKIKAGTFRFADTFPTSKNVDYFRKKEKELLKLKERPDEVLFKSEALAWLDRHRFLDVTGRTILGYKSQMVN